MTPMRMDTNATPIINLKLMVEAASVVVVWAIDDDDDDVCADDFSSFLLFRFTGLVIVDPISRDLTSVSPSDVPILLSSA